MLRARIIGTGHHLPQQALTNQDLEKFMDTTDEWIQQRTGIKQRYRAADGEGASDLAIPASRRALEAAGVDPKDLELIICGTTTPDYVIPATACVIQDALGATRAGAFDVNAACSGFVYALATANAYIQAGLYRTILVIGTEVITSRLNWEKRDTAILFGDGAGAVVVRAEEGERGILSANLGADGASRELLIMHGGGSKCVFTPDNILGPERDIQMRGTELFKKAVVAFSETAQKALADANVTIGDVDLFIPHQANTRIIYTAAERLGLPLEKVCINIDRVGNTTAASIPIALDEAVRAGRVKDGNLILLSAFGAGLTWGSLLLRW